jgi:hypothetical protein
MVDVARMPMISSIGTFAVSTSLAVATLLAQSEAPARQPQPAPARPKITGVAGIAVKAKDLTTARAFYSTIIGLAEAFQVKNPLGGSELTSFKINERQYVYVSARSEGRRGQPVVVRELRDRRCKSAADQTPCCSTLNDPIDKRADAGVFREIATRGLLKSHLGERPMR